MIEWVGHDEAWTTWRAALASARMHHAWLVVGPRGVGKGTFARSAAQALVATDGIAQPSGENHPDIMVLEPLPDGEAEAKKKEEGKPFRAKRSVSVDQIRTMLRRLETKPTLGDRRAIVIDAVDDLEAGGVNALLKALEEPSAGTYFLLVSHMPGRLLPTVRSRCRILRFDRVGAGDMELILAREAPQVDDATRKAAIVAAQGSPAVALAFIEQDLAPIHQLMQRIVRDGDADFALRGKLADAIGARPDRERQLAAIELALATLALDLGAATPARQSRMIDAYTALVRLGREAPTYNYDAGLLVMEIGGLLASAAMPREAA